MVAATQQTSLDIILPRLSLGLILSALIGFIAYRRGSLSRSGVLGAIIIGTLIFGFGGLIAGLLLIAFFVTSSALSHFKEGDTQKRRAAEKFDKGGQRDLGQALANGGAATLFAVFTGLLDRPYALWSYAAMLGALATVNADTWATELGVLSQTPPRSITHLSRVVEPGTSGGVTLAGTLAAVAGAAFIGLAFVVLQVVGQLLGSAFSVQPTQPTQPAQLPPTLAIAGLIGGIAGSFFDSFLGATVQAMYFSDKRSREAERAIERDGTPNRLIRGWRWLNNDRVNFVSSVVGAVVAAVVVLLMG